MTEQHDGRCPMVLKFAENAKFETFGRVSPQCCFFVQNNKNRFDIRVSSGFVFRRLCIIFDKLAALVETFSLCISTVLNAITVARLHPFSV